VNGYIPELSTSSHVTLLQMPRNQYVHIAIRVGCMCGIPRHQMYRRRRIPSLAYLLPYTNHSRFLLSCVKNCLQMLGRECFFGGENSRFSAVWEVETCTE